MAEELVSGLIGSGEGLVANQNNAINASVASADPTIGSFTARDCMSGMGDCHDYGGGNPREIKSCAPWLSP